MRSVLLVIIHSRAEDLNATLSAASHKMGATGVMLVLKNVKSTHPAYYHKSISSLQDKRCDLGQQKV